MSRVIAYAVEGEILCPRCAREADLGEASPAFSTDEHPPEGMTCDHCLDEITAPYGYALVKCDQCRLARINGTVCHEIGCPNMGAKWDVGEEKWVHWADCVICGYEVERGDVCNHDDEWLGFKESEDAE